MNGLHEFDLSGFRAINVGLHSVWLDPFFCALSYFGLGASQTIFSLLFALHRSTRHFVLPLLIAAALGGFGVADGLKAVIVRDRPSNLPFAIRQEPWLESSFPSGHTTLVFSVATMLLFLTWNTRYRWVGPVGLVVAALVGVSRIYRGVHWPTDVIGGACCGIATSCFLYLVLPRLKLPVVKESPPV